MAGVLSIITGALVAVSQTSAYLPDEGFHLLAARLIQAGRTPYLDFLHTNPPLYAYLNAAFLRLFADSWRVPHAISALAASGAVLLIADYLFRRMARPAWKAPAALAAAVLAGFSALTASFATVGQPYGVCLLLAVAGFRLAAAAPPQGGAVQVILAGACAGGAAGCSLLTLPILFILAVWLCWRAGRDGWRNFVAYSAGASVPFLPLLWLLLKAPEPTLFGVFEYQLLHRRQAWVGRDILAHDLAVAGDLLRDPRNVLLGILALAARVSLRAPAKLHERMRSELTLCGWLAAGLAAWLSCAHPTFKQYFVLVVPYLAILGAVGAWVLAERIRLRSGPAVVTILFLSLGLFSAARWIHQLTRPGPVFPWIHYENVARQVAAVTLPDRPIYAVEQVYFCSRHLPPEGLEHSFARYVNVSPAPSKLLHVVPLAELKRRLGCGHYDTVALDSQDPDIEELKIADRYQYRLRIGSDEVFWGKRTASELPCASAP